MGADVCSALTYGYPNDFRTTDGARLTSASVNFKMVLEITATVNPVYTGSVITNTFLEHIDNSPEKFFSLFSADRILKGLAGGASQDTGLRLYRYSPSRQ